MTSAVRTVLVFAALSAAPALATAPVATESFTRTTVPSTEICLAWNSRQVSVSVDPAGSSRTPGDTELTAIERSVKSWRDAITKCSDLALARGAAPPKIVVGKVTGSGGTNLITFRENSCRDVPPGDPCRSDDSCGNKHSCWDHGDVTIGLTTTTFSTRTGTIQDADIELNSAPASLGRGFLFTTVDSPACPENAPASTCVHTDVENTVTHELGHLLGLDHVEGRLNSTMAATAPVADLTKRIIDPGSADAICRIYPIGLPPTPCDERAAARPLVLIDNKGTPGLDPIGCATATGPGTLACLAWLLRRRRRS
jgi:hypothetical protein